MGRGPSIEGRKNAEDAKRAKVFTKLIREITVATRAGVADPAGNPRLRAAVDKALSANMTRDTIERAIKRGSGTDGGADMQELRYEGYGPAGIALIIECFTDNPTRTVADVRYAHDGQNGNRDHYFDQPAAAGYKRQPRILPVVPNTVMARMLSRSLGRPR